MVAAFRNSAYRKKMPLTGRPAPNREAEPFTGRSGFSQVSYALHRDAGPLTEMLGLSQEERASQR